METVRIKKEKLRAILLKNREDHHGIFIEAQKKYREVAIEKLDEQLRIAREGKPFQLMMLAALTPPEDHTKDYDRVLGMLDLSEDDVIELSNENFKCYVQDQWNWTRSWAVSNSRYSSADKLKSAFED
jgi:NOL1/NOP2/fmu family ribosome biogenesis protein